MEYNINDSYSNSITQPQESQPQESQPDLLYFFLSADRLVDLYRRLFTETSTNIPFHIYGENNEMMNTVDYRPIMALAEQLHKIFDISIKVENSKLTYFGNEVIRKNKGDIYLDANNKPFKYQMPLPKFYLPNGRIVYDSVKEVEGIDDLKKIQDALKINITNCNVICRFFILPVKPMYEFDPEFDNNIVYNAQFKKDKNNIKKIYIADDMMKKNVFANYYNNHVLYEIFARTDPSERPEVILLPCLHENAPYANAIPDGKLEWGMSTSTNMCNYKGDIDPLCQSFKVNGLSQLINTDIYTTFYGKDKVRKSNFFDNNPNREHCRDYTFISIALTHYVNTKNDANTDNINRIENTQGGRRRKKQTRKTKKPKKRSRKTRKHKKSRKH